MSPEKRGKRLGIIALAQNSWRGVWMNRQQLLSRLGAHHSIIYTNGMWFAWDRDKPDCRNSPWFGDLQKMDSVVVDHAPRLLKRWPRLPLYDEAIIRLGAMRWLRQLRDCRACQLVAYVFSPEFEPYVKALPYDYLVYHAYDLYSMTPGWTSAHAMQEASLLEKADLVVASSQVISQHLGGRSGRTVVTLPNAVDYGAYRAAADSARSLPADLDRIPHPRIGYAGNLNRKVDFGLVAALAGSRPAWQFVVIGGLGNLDRISSSGYEQCLLMENVHFLGQKNVSELPYYVAGMDVNIMCYRISDDVWTAAIYPLKLHEYLATGHPVVSADIPAVREFSSQVAIAGTLDEWVRALEDALVHGGVGTADGRREIARNNTWEIRAAELNVHLQNMVSD